MCGSTWGVWVHPSPENFGFLGSLKSHLLQSVKQTQMHYAEVVAFVLSRVFCGLLKVLVV